MCELDAEMVFGWVRNRTSIAKQHLAPSPRNVRLVLEAARQWPPVRVLLLTRDVASSVHAVCERALHPELSGPAKPLRNASVAELRERAQALAAWQEGWQRAAAMAADVLWPFTFEQMRERGREAPLGEALRALGLAVRHEFKDVSRRLVNRSDDACDMKPEAGSRT